MKYFALTLVVVLFGASPAFAAVEEKPGKFKTTFTITYNEITLKEAADLESLIQKQHASSCKVKTNLCPVDDALIFFTQ